MLKPANRWGVSMKYFFHEGKAYLASGSLPDAVADWMLHTAGGDRPAVCACCNVERDDVSKNGWHCRSCRDRAVRQFENPSFTGRVPTGGREADAMRDLPVWQENFDAKVDRSGGEDACHIWTASSLPSGYGMFRIVGRSFLAHRLSYLMAGGDFGHPIIMHMCDNPSCVNPKHLRGGSARDNVVDMIQKGRNRPSPAMHLRDRKIHPRAMRVSTPRGVFPSAALAAEEFGISRGYAAWQAKNGLNGWAYLLLDQGA
jgi:hypothetical protein